jgi:hypothetical protein
MAAKIAFHFRESPDPRNYLDRWRINCEALGAKLIIIDTSPFEIAKHYSHKIVEVYKSLEEVEKKHKTIIYLESPHFLDKAGVKYQWLHEFKHPKNAVYIVGDNYAALQMKGRENKIWVSIKILKETTLYDDTAAMIALYDRKVKEWLSQ